MPSRPDTKSAKLIDAATYRRLERKAGFSNVLKNKVRSLSEYLEVLNALFVDPTDVFWFRGHDDVEWELCPSALRYPEATTRHKAIVSLAEFRRIERAALWMLICGSNKAPGSEAGRERLNSEN